MVKNRRLGFPPSILIGLPPFTCIVDDGVNPLPVMATEVSGEFTGMELGLMFVSVGAGYVTMLSVELFEPPPPGEGVTTVICAVPRVATSAAVTAHVSFDEFTYVVGQAAPFHCTTDVGINPIPFTNSVNAGPPWTTLLGTKNEITGVGLTIVTACVVLEDPPAGAGLDAPI